MFYELMVVCVLVNGNASCGFNTDYVTAHTTAEPCLARAEQALEESKTDPTLSTVRMYPHLMFSGCVFSERHFHPEEIKSTELDAIFKKFSDKDPKARVWVRGDPV